MQLIAYKRTVVGWYNFRPSGTDSVHNIEPDKFRRLAGVSERAELGTAEVTTEILSELKEQAIHL